MNKKAYDTDTFEIVTVNWFAVAGVILGAIVANVVTWGIASINGMVVAALCYVIGEIYKRESMRTEVYCSCAFFAFIWSQKINIIC